MTVLYPRQFKKKLIQWSWIQHHRNDPGIHDHVEEVLGTSNVSEFILYLVDSEVNKSLEVVRYVCVNK